MLFSKIAVFLPDGTIENNLYVATRKDRIEYIGADFPAAWEGETYNGKGKLLLPGFVNTHCHIPMTLLRSQGSGLPLSQWLTRSIFPIEARLNDDFVYWGACLGIAELLQSGVTSFNDMYFHVSQTARAILESGIKGNIAVSIAADKEISSAKELPCFHEAKLVFTQYHNTGFGRLQIDFCIHAEYSSNLAIVQEVSSYARKNKARIQLHLSETEEETKQCIQRHGKTPTEYFQHAGLFQNPTTAAHCVYLTDEDREILKANQVTVSHCPISNLKLGSGIADIPKLLDKGILVTLGTDGAASNDNLNFLEDMKFAALLAKGLYRDPSKLSVPQILTMATRNGALSQGRASTGQIAEGCQADLIVLNTDAVNLLPSQDILSSLVYAAIPSNIVLTMVDGRILYRDGNFITLDIEKILWNIKRIQKKLYC